jgi:hypothetical protein
MNMKTSKILTQAARGALVVGAAGALASCGGSDHDDNNVPPVAIDFNIPPASASASVDGFIAFMKGVVATTPDTLAPLDVANFVAPTSDTTEPDQTI